MTPKVTRQQFWNSLNPKPSNVRCGVPKASKAKRKKTKTLITDKVRLSWLKPSDTGTESNLRQVCAFFLVAMASILFNSNSLHPKSNGLHPKSNGLHPQSNGLHPQSDGLHPNSLSAMASILRAMASNLEATRPTTFPVVFWFQGVLSGGS